MAKIPHLEIGQGYTKIELVDLINEPKVENLQVGLLYCDNQPATCLFVTLVKTGRDEQHQYNDFFENDYFHWDSQNQQSISNNRIQDMIMGNVDVHLFVRLRDKISGRTQPFLYAGELKYSEHTPGQNNPCHLVFESLDYLFENTPQELQEVYDWRPGKKAIRPNIQTGGRKVTQRRKRTYAKPNETERKGLVTSRVGQGYYREQVLEKWNYTCALTGCSIQKILIASHIVPWSASNDDERLDPNNGILLSPDVDALFDRHLISFEDNGKLLVSDQITSAELKRLGIDSNATIKVDQGMIPYLKKHRNKFQS